MNTYSIYIHYVHHWYIYLSFLMTSLFYQPPKHSIKLSIHIISSHLLTFTSILIIFLCRIWNIIFIFFSHIISNKFIISNIGMHFVLQMNMATHLLKAFIDDVLFEKQKTFRWLILYKSEYNGLFKNF